MLTQRFGGCDGLTAVTGILVMDAGFLESVRQVYAVDVFGLPENETIQEIARPGRCLLMDPFSERRQYPVSLQVVEPIDHHQVVATPPFSPIGPMVQPLVRERCRLIAEIVAHHFRNPLVPRGHIILFQHFQGHHPGPPVLGVAPLKAGHVRPVLRRAEEAVFPLGGQHRLHPHLRLFLQGGIVQLISKRQQSVYPVRSPLPGVTFPAEPGIVGAHHFGIDLVQMSGETVGLALQLLFQPIW